MEIYIRIIDLIFPNYEKAEESRFNKFFSENKNNRFMNKGIQLNGYKILIGEDKRTTIFIKNLPKNMTKNQLKMIIEKIANINYIYIPLFMLSAYNLRCAFVNVINSKSIIDIYLQLKKINFHYDNPNIKMEITYSKLQGKKALIENFRDERNILKNNKCI